MSIESQITRLTNAKAAIKQSITNKGVEVSDAALLDEYPALIDKIEVGSGGSCDHTDSSYYSLYLALTNNGKSYYNLFENSAATTIDVSDFDTSNVTSMSRTFYGCTKLTSLDLSNWDTSKVTTMYYMFYNCYGLIELDLSDLDTGNVTNMNSMFYFCNKLTSLNLNNWDTSKVTDMSYMFCQCQALTSLDLSNFDTSNVTTMSNMFSSCRALTSLDLSNFDISNVTTMNNMFSSCAILESLDLSVWDVSHVTNMGSFCSGTFKLTDIKAPKNISASISFDNCGINAGYLSHDSLMSIINNLATVTSTKTLTLNSGNLAKLTDEEKAIATGKGWTLK